MYFIIITVIAVTILCFKNYLLIISFNGIFNKLQ
jgi:hypothetical protein